MAKIIYYERDGYLVALIGLRQTFKGQKEKCENEKIKADFKQRLGDRRRKIYSCPQGLQSSLGTTVNEIFPWKSPEELVPLAS